MELSGNQKLKITVVRSGGRGSGDRSGLWLSAGVPGTSGETEIKRFEEAEGATNKIQRLPIYQVCGETAMSPVPPAREPSVPNELRGPPLR